MWGVSEKETFVIEPGELTENFEDNSRIAILRQSDIFLLYLAYNKGSEQKIEIGIAYSLSLSGEQFFEESLVSNSDGKVAPFYHFLDQSDFFRLALPVAVSEVRVRVSVRAQGTSPFSGRLELFYATNNLRPQKQ